MKKDLEFVLYVVWWAARAGDELAKRELWELVVTVRKRIIFAHLIKRGVRWADLSDAHQNIAVKVYKKIQLLETTRAYPAFEARIASGEARKWRDLYSRFSPEPVEDVLEQAGGL